MPVVLVSDTSVLVDLERGGFLDAWFKLPFEFAVPDLLYRRELEQIGGAELIARGLRVEELTSDELSSAQRVKGSEGVKAYMRDYHVTSRGAAFGRLLIEGPKK